MSDLFIKARCRKCRGSKSEYDFSEGVELECQACLESPGIVLQHWNKLKPTTSGTYIVYASFDGGPAEVETADFVKGDKKDRWWGNEEDTEEPNVFLWMEFPDAPGGEKRRP